MDAADFVIELRNSGTTGPYRFDRTDGARTEVVGKIDFNSIGFEKNLIIKNVDFRCAVALNNCKFSGSVIIELLHF